MKKPVQPKIPVKITKTIEYKTHLLDDARNLSWTAFEERLMTSLKISEETFRNQITITEFRCSFTKSVFIEFALTQETVNINYENELAAYAISLEKYKEELGKYEAYAAEKDKKRKETIVNNLEKKLADIKKQIDKHKK
jgi:hypothetical protein